MAFFASFNTDSARDVLNQVTSSCQQIAAVKSEISGKEMRMVVIEALTKCLNDLVQIGLYPFEAIPELRSPKPPSGSERSLQILSLHDKIQSYRRCSNKHPNEIYKLHLIGSTNLEDFVLATDKDPKGSKQLNVDGSPSSGCSDHLLVAVSTLVITLRDTLMESWADLLLDPSVVKFYQSFILEPTNNPHSQYEVANETSHRLARNILKVLHRLSQCLDRMSPVPVEESAHCVHQHCDHLIEYISGKLDQLKAAENGTLLPENPSLSMEMSEVASKESRSFWLQDAVDRVDARLEEYEDDLDQLLSSCNLWEEDSWIECLERNANVLAHPRFVKQLIDVAMLMNDQEMTEVLFQRVLKILLASFCTLPFLLQNNLRDYLWSHPTGVAIFTEHPVQNVGYELTSVFNRLVTSALGQENTDVLSALSCMAMQSPSQMLLQAVQRAVSNAAVCRAVCQILQAMPSLATFRPQGYKWPLLCYLIQEAAGNLSTSTNEEENLLQLVTALVKPYKSFLDPQSPFWMPRILSAQAISQICVLPYLKNSPQNSGQVNLVTALKLLQGLLDVNDISHLMPDTDDTIFGSSPFPVMLCLCELLDSCHLLWDDVALAMQKVEVKEIVIDLLGGMTRSVKLMHGQGNERIDQRGVAWLLNQVCATLHWTTALRVNDLLSELLPHKIKLVPECLFDMCNLPDSTWYPVPSVDNQRVPTSLCDKLTEFLQCARISDSTATILIQSIQLKETSHQSLQEALMLALVQVLPHCIMGEWQCIMGMLRQFVANGLLRVPCSTQYLRELPVLDISGFRVHLSLSQLLLSVMQLLGSPCCEDWATPQLLHHVTRCHVDTMQNLASEILNSDLRNEPGSLFVIGQMFCHSCEVISNLPTHDLKEQVFVLTLQFLSHLEELRRTDISNQDFDSEWTNQRSMFELVANQKLVGEQRRALLQKLTCY